MALAVGLTPELLPMVTTVTLSRGAMRMARKQVVVKRLAAIHDLGAMDVLCTDKTGTLTQAQIILARKATWIALGRDSTARVLEPRRSLNSSALRDRPARRRSTRRSLSTTPRWTSIRWRKIDEVQFDFERRRVLRASPTTEGQRLLVLKGAFEDGARLIARDNEGPGRSRAISDLLDDSARRTLPSQRFEMHSGREGFRLLGIAWPAHAGGRNHRRA